MTYVYSADGSTIEATRSRLPSRLTRKLDGGEWATPTKATAADFGLYPVSVVGSDEGDGWRLGPIVNSGPGDFSRTWEFDQALADAVADNAARDARQARAASVRQALDDRADFYDAQPNATTNAQALQYVNTMKNDMAELFRVTADIIQALRLD